MKCKDFLADVPRIEPYTATTSAYDNVLTTTPSHARFHRQCYQKFTDKRKLEQAQRKRKILRDSDKTEFEGEFLSLCLQ